MGHGRTRIRDEKVMQFGRHGKLLITLGLRCGGGKRLTKNRVLLRSLACPVGVRWGAGAAPRDAVFRVAHSGTLWHIQFPIFTHGDRYLDRSCLPSVASKNIDPSVLPAALREKRSGRATISLGFADFLGESRKDFLELSRRATKTVSGNCRGGGDGGVR